MESVNQSGIAAHALARRVLLEVGFALALDLALAFALAFAIGFEPVAAFVLLLPMGLACLAAPLDSTAFAGLGLVFLVGFAADFVDTPVTVRPLDPCRRLLPAPRPMARDWPEGVPGLPDTTGFLRVAV